MHVGFPGIVTKVYPCPGYWATVLQKSQKFRVRVRGSYRTCRSSGYGTEVLQNSQKLRVLWHGRTELTEVIQMIYPYTGYMWHWRTELPEVPGTGMTVVQKFQKFLVWV